jgi:dihydrofolate reductase
MIVSLIFALDEDNAIGLNNALPWHLPADLKRFKEVTMGHHVIMGRLTAESLGKALPGRTNIVITSNELFNIPGMIIKKSLPEALDLARQNGEKEAFIIGGATLFMEAMEHADRFYLTRIHATFPADTYLPVVDEDKWTVAMNEDYSPDEKNLYPYTFQILERKR